MQAAIKNGRIGRSAGGLIDFAAADLEWDANFDPEVRARRQAKAAPKPSDKKSLTYSEARTRHVAAKARIAELDLKRQRGELMAAEDVRSAVFAAARTARDQLRGLGPRLAPLLAAMSNPLEIQAAIDSEVERACNGLFVEPGK